MFEGIWVFETCVNKNVSFTFEIDGELIDPMKYKTFTYYQEKFIYYVIHPSYMVFEGEKLTINV